MFRKNDENILISAPSELIDISIDKRYSESLITLFYTPICKLAKYNIKLSNDENLNYSYNGFNLYAVGNDLINVIFEALSNNDVSGKFNKRLNRLAYFVIFQ